MIARDLNRIEARLCRTQWWTQWQTTARGETLELIKQWESGTKPRIKNSVWYELRDRVLLPVFRGKCAYCESKLSKVQQLKGEVEHYRPKNEVHVRQPDGKRALVRVQTPDGELIEHPGYFWLSYDWRNLLPSCRACNVGLNGKRNFFPTISAHVLLLRSGAHGAQQPSRLDSTKYPGYYYPSSPELDFAEKPLLLHPGTCDPSQHLNFEDLGEVLSRNSDHAEKTIHHLNLSVDAVTGNRREAQLLVEGTFITAFTHFRSEGFAATEAARQARAKIRHMLVGSAAYSAAIRAQVERTAQAVSQALVPKAKA